MKKSKSSQTGGNQVTHSHKTAPENKDNLDSRKNEEQDVRANGKTSHHAKPVHNNKHEK